MRTLCLAAALTAASALALVGAQGAAAAGLPQLEAQHLHTCAVMPDSSAACWGNNDYGQSSAPAGSFAQVSGGYWTSCGVRTDGSVACWGWNGYGQNSPPSGQFTSVSVGYAHACGLRVDATVACWAGYGYGTGPPGGTFKEVGAGNDWSCGLRTDGTLSCWGYGGHGEMSYPSGTFTSLSVGVNHGCAVRTDGTVACWGYNPNGATNAPAGTFTSVSAGQIHSCGVRTDGTLACWGYNGTGAATPPSGTFTSVTTGTYHSCAVATSGAIVCWGYNGDRQTDAPVTDSTPPTIASDVSGPLGDNGWYTGDVSLDWSVTEPEAPDSLVLDGCVDAAITADQAETAYSCSASSTGGSAGPVYVTIKRDATAPTVQCPSPAPTFVLGEGAVVSAAVSDATSGPAAASVSAAADTAAAGVKSVSLTGVDNAGNEATVACSYRVGYGFGGFFQPVDNDLLNRANAGRAIPLKWRLVDASGSPVTDLAAVSITTITLGCATLTEGLDAIEEYAAGASGLQNLGDGFYQVNWKSPSAYAGTCKRLRLDLGEGVYRTVDFRFVK
ncbi:MAG: PxKF domain-containing protein [Gaiellaceae bacterium]